MVELISKFDEKSTVSVQKSELTAKMPFKIFRGHIRTYNMDTNTDHITAARTCTCRVKMSYA